MFKLFKVYFVNSRIVANIFQFLPDRRACNLRRQKVENRTDKQQILVHKITQHNIIRTKHNTTQEAFANLFPTFPEIRAAIASKQIHRENSKFETLKNIFLATERALRNIC